MNDPSQPAPPPKYLWPKFVLAAFLLGVLLAVLAVFKETRRIQRIKSSTEAVQANPPGARLATNPAVNQPGTKR